jgi:alginate O-acetyltransferase complex protein AlgJ
MLDLTEPMSRAEVRGTHQFLHADTHWSPAGIDTAAKATAAFISQTVNVPPSPRVYQRQDVPLQLTEGDLVQLLDLPRSQSRQLGRQAVVMQRVLEPTGSTWQSDPSSGVLLIGDSFSELFSLEGAGPTGAGFAEQISFYLQHPLERRASHAAVEFDTRQGLGRSLAEVRAVAPRYRVVIWEFAVRKLAALDWPLLPEGR